MIAYVKSLPVTSSHLQQRQRAGSVRTSKPNYSIASTEWNQLPGTAEEDVASCIALSRATYEAPYTSYHGSSYLVSPKTVVPPRQRLAVLFWRLLSTGLVSSYETHIHAGRC